MSEALSSQPGHAPSPERSSEPDTGGSASLSKESQLLSRQSKWAKETADLEDALAAMGGDSIMAKRACGRLMRRQMEVGHAEKHQDGTAWSHRGGKRPEGVEVRRKATPRERADDPGEARGLVKAPNLAVWGGGRLIEVSLPGMPPTEVGGRRECDGMSDKSRRALLAELQKIDRRAPLPVLMTLTFPEEVRVSAVAAKACRRAFMKRLKRRHKKLAAVWRMEAHPEMSRRLGYMHPHFHLLTWGAFYDLKWVSRTWTACIWSVLELDECLWAKDGRLVREKSVEAGTNCERIRTWAGVPYVVKTYIGKGEEYPVGKAGRVWGFDFRDRLPIAKCEVIELTTLQTVAVKRRLEEWMTTRGISTEYGPLRAIFCDTPTAFAAMLLAPTTWQREKEYHDSGTNYG